MYILKILIVLIWFIFFYFSYILSLAHGFFWGIVVILFIVWGSLISEILNKKIYKKNNKFYEYYTYPLVYIIVILFFVFWYQNTTWMYVIKNWDKEIIFQWMHHVWTQKYYDQVRNNIKKYKQDDFIFVYEGITLLESASGSQVDTKLKNIFAGTDFFVNKYFISEEKKDFLWIVNDKDYNIDISNKEIEELYEKWANIIPSSQSEKKQKFFNEQFLRKEILDYKQKYITILDVKIIWAYYNAILFLGEYFNSNSMNDVLLDSILVNYRNEHLLNGIIKLDNKKIFIMYWEWHIKWFYELLKKQNDNWEIIEIKKMYPFEL